MPLLVDTGVLYASMDRRDAHHAACRALLEQTTEALLVPAPVLVELDHFVRRRLHSDAHIRLLGEVANGALPVAELRAGDYIRVRDLCAKYADADIGFVDASVVAIAERLNEPKIASLDRRHFGVIRPRHVDSLTLLP